MALGLQVIKTGNVVDGTLDTTNEEIIYTIEITNTGDEDYDSVEITDALLGLANVDVETLAGAFLSESVATDGVLAAGETWTISGDDLAALVYQLQQIDLDSNGTNEPDNENPGFLDNETEAVAFTEGGLQRSASGSWSEALFINPDISIVKNVTDVGGDGAGGTADEAGDVITYEIVVTNEGNVSLTGVVLTDDLLEGANGTLGAPVESLTADGILEVGETWTYAGTYAVQQADLDGNGIDDQGVADDDGDIDNTASVDTDQTDPESDDAVVPILFGPDISIVKNVTDVDGAGPGGIVNAAGDVITYGIVVTNEGNISLTNVVLTDDLLEGANGTLGAPVESLTADGILEVGETWTYAGTYTVQAADLGGIDDQGAPDGDNDIDNIASVDTDQTDPESDDAVVPIEVPPPSDPGGNTRGFWRHWDDALDESLDNVGLDPGDSYESVFGVDLTGNLDGITLEDALSVRGGGIRQLIPQSVAALANAAMEEADYSFAGFEAVLDAAGVLDTLHFIDTNDDLDISVDEIIAVVGNVIPDGDAGGFGVEDVKDAFDVLNNTLPEVGASEFDSFGV